MRSQKRKARKKNYIECPYCHLLVGEDELDQHMRSVHYDKWIEKVFEEIEREVKRDPVLHAAFLLVRDRRENGVVVEYFDEEELNDVLKELGVNMSLSINAFAQKLDELKQIFERHELYLDYAIREEPYGTFISIAFDDPNNYDELCGPECVVKARRFDDIDIWVIVDFEDGDIDVVHDLLQETLEIWSVP